MITKKCPCCPLTFEADTELQVTLLVVEHLRTIPETEHMKQLEIRLAELERLIGMGRAAALERCARLDEHLKAIHLLAVSTLSLAVEKLRDLLRVCDGHTSIRNTHAAQSLLRNISDALLAANRRFK